MAAARWPFSGPGSRPSLQMAAATPATRPAPHLVLAAAGLLRREGGSQRPGTPGARRRAGEPSAASTTPDDGLAATQASRGPRATGCHLTFWVWLHSVLSPRSLAPLFGVLRPERRAQPRGRPRPWTSEPRGGLERSGDPRAYRDVTSVARGLTEVSCARSSAGAGSEGRGRGAERKMLTFLLPQHLGEGRVWKARD